MADTVRLFIDAWKLMARRFPSPQIEEAHGLASCFANVPLIFFNLWFQTRPATTSDELRALLGAGVKRAATCEHAAGGILRQDWLPTDWEEVVKEAGLAPMMPMTGMETGQILAPRRRAANLEIRRVVDDTTARDLAVVNAHSYGMPPESFECMANTRLWRADSYGYVGYVDGKPASSAAAFPVAGTVYVALVATMPDARGKGYAETVMRHAIAHGQQAMGTTQTTLHATDMGRPVYQAMGYAPSAKLILVGPAHS